MYSLTKNVCLYYKILAFVQNIGNEALYFLIPPTLHAIIHS